MQVTQHKRCRIRVTIVKAPEDGIVGKQYKVMLTAVSVSL